MPDSDKTLGEILVSFPCHVLFVNVGFRSKADLADTLCRPSSAQHRSALAINPTVFFIFALNIGRSA